MTDRHMPAPAVGDRVHFWARSTIGVNDKLQPFAGTVVFVHSPSLVNLSAHDHAGNPRSVASVQLRAPNPMEDQHAADRQYATWPVARMIEEAKARHAEASLDPTAGAAS